MSNLVRYVPGESLKWLEVGADTSYQDAREQVRSVIARQGDRTIGRDIKEAAGAILSAGKGAVTDLIHRRANESEYAFDETKLEVIQSGAVKSYPYKEFRRVRRSGDKVIFEMEKGSLRIEPLAYIVSGRIKVPIGWIRNGIDVPYELLIEELAKRCRLPIEQA
jgi:hypothetical protein